MDRRDRELDTALFVMLVLLVAPLVASLVRHLPIGAEATLCALVGGLAGWALLSDRSARRARSS